MSRDRSTIGLHLQDTFSTKKQLAVKLWLAIADNLQSAFFPVSCPPCLEVSGPARTPELYEKNS